jgi:hypothetical protein
MKCEPIETIRGQLDEANALVEQLSHGYGQMIMREEQLRIFRKAQRKRQELQSILDILECSVWCVILSKADQMVVLRPYRAAQGLDGEFLFTGTQDECIAIKLKNFK